MEAVSQNHFFVDVVRAMAQFNPAGTACSESQKAQKEAAAMFFVEK